jgi:hypothetical protein
MYFYYEFYFYYIYDNQLLNIILHKEEEKKLQI